jgi:hypothetical protein
MFANKDFNTAFYMAKRFGISRLAASRMRKRYLYELQFALWADGSKLALHWLWDVQDEIAYLDQHERFELVVKTNGQQITDEMVQTARKVPVTAVLSFDAFGKAKAWCHSDNHPSLTFLSRKKLAWCPVCNRYFSALDVLIDRDHYSFIDAVRYLTT